VLDFKVFSQVDKLVRLQAKGCQPAVTLLNHLTFKYFRLANLLGRCGNLETNSSPNQEEILSKNQKIKIEDEVAALMHERDRRGKAVMTLDQRLKILEEIYDGALLWLRQAVISARSKGVGGATMVLERSRMEMEALSSANYTVNDNRYIIGYEQSLPCQKNSN
jgi:hypothetical protein